MKNIENNLKKYSQTLELSHTEKTNSFSIIQDYMKSQPLLLPPRSPYTPSLGLLLRHLNYSVAVIVLLSVTSVSFAAEYSRPGDTLYPVRLRLNDNIRTSLAVGSVAKAKAHISLAQERIAEIDAAVIDGSLDSESLAYASDSLIDHTTEAALIIKEGDGDDRLAVSLQTALATFDAKTSLQSTTTDVYDEDTGTTTTIDLSDIHDKVIAIKAMAKEIQDDMATSTEATTTATSTDEATTTNNTTSTSTNEIDTGKDDKEKEDKDQKEKDKNAVEIEDVVNIDIEVPNLIR